MVLEETKKGPWTEQEDMKLVCFVSLFGERRWDFIAKVSGLNRTGKSCRLRWVNYLHPGLQRGKMTPQEEHLVLELHSKWGNRWFLRWSRIARKLPGRTDNEIKNYWRTHTRKQAQEMRKRNLIPSSSSSSSLCNINSSSSMSATTEASMDSFPYDLHCVKSDQNIGKNKGDGGASSAAHLVSGPGECEHKEEDAFKDYPMEQIWKEIASTEMVSEALLDENFRFDGGTFPGTPMDIPSPIWDYQSYEEFEYPAWKMNEEELNLWFPTDAHVFYNQHEGDNK